MKKLLLLAVLLLGFEGTGLAQQANDVTVRQRNPFNTGWLDRFLSPPVGGVDGLMYINGSTTQAGVITLGSGLSISGGVLSAAASSAPAWADVTGKPTFATVATSGVYNDLLSKPTLFSGVYSDLSAKPTTLAGYGITDGATSTALAAKFNAPTGNTGQYLRGDGTLATFPSIPTFSFGLPFARTLALSTAYQATDPSKSAVIVPSYSCTNATTVLAASGCTVQVRMSATTLTCSTGAVYYTQSLTVALGVLITQASIQPVPISLATGAYFILCPTAGTFTVSAIEQTAG